MVPTMCSNDSASLLPVGGYDQIKSNPVYFDTT